MLRPKKKPGPRVIKFFHVFLTGQKISKREREREAERQRQRQRVSESQRVREKEREGWREREKDLDSTWMGDRLGTPGAVGIL